MEKVEEKMSLFKLLVKVEGFWTVVYYLAESGEPKAEIARVRTSMLLRSPEDQEDFREYLQRALGRMTREVMKEVTGEDLPADGVLFQKKEVEIPREQKIDKEIMQKLQEIVLLLNTGLGTAVVLVTHGNGSGMCISNLEDDSEVAALLGEAIERMDKEKQEILQ